MIISKKYESMAEQVVSVMETLSECLVEEIDKIESFDGDEQTLQLEKLRMMAKVGDMLSASVIDLITLHTIDNDHKGIAYRSDDSRIKANKLIDSMDVTKRLRAANEAAEPLISRLVSKLSFNLEAQ